MARRRCYFIEVNVCKFWNETGDFFLIILVEAFLLLWLVRPFPTRRSCSATPPPMKKSRIGEDAPTPEIARLLCL
jgi:hypothetical protein